MRTADLVTAAVLMLLGGVVIFDALRLGIGWGTDGPRSGFFPFWLAVLMMATVCADLRAGVAAAGDPRVRVTGRAATAGPVRAGAGDRHGRRHAGDRPLRGLRLYVAFYMRWIGRHRWPATIAMAVGLSVVTFLVFEEWFLVPMPKGPLEAWLGY